MTVKMETIMKKVNELEKLNISSSEIAFGNVVNNKTQYHDQILKIRKTLNAFSRDLSKAEKAYIEQTTKNELWDTFENLVKNNDGNMQMALDQIKRAATSSQVTPDTTRPPKEDTQNTNAYGFSDQPNYNRQ